jgi:hypothetical protein
MQYVLNEVNNNKGKAKQSPWVEKVDIAPEDIDSHISSIGDDAPRLYLFFKGNEFKLAEVAADKCVIHLQAADVVKALMTYIAVYFVFHVGFPEVYRQFLGFMQYAMLGIKYEGRKSLGHIALLHTFDNAMVKKTESKKFKKFCV